MIKIESVSLIIGKTEIPKILMLILKRVKFTDLSAETEAEKPC